MTGIACWLAVVAVIDIVRTGRSITGVVGLAALCLPAVVVLAVLGIAAGPSGWGIAAWAIGAVGLLAWITGSAQGWATRPPSPRASAAAFVGFGVALVAFASAGAQTGDFSYLDGVARTSVFSAVAPARAALLAAVALAQFGTANLLVRLLLERVGVPAPDNEKRLRGGRFLGPMERLLIFGLGLAGSLGGAAVVVAAKALLRFPELRDARSRGAPGGASDVTEYFLVGSFASWIIAFGGLALCALT